MVVVTSRSTVAGAPDDDLKPALAPTPWRVPGAAHAVTVITLDLLPGTNAYCDTYRQAPPILVIDFGPTEVQLSIPGDRITLDDLRLIDLLLEAMAAYRTALIANLGVID